MAVSISAPGRREGRATPTPDSRFPAAGSPSVTGSRPGPGTRSAGTLADMSSRDDDLDWLYGRDAPSRSVPEPTQVMPGSFGPSGGPAGGPVPPMTPTPPGARPPGQSVPGPEQSAPFDTAAYDAVPAYGQGSSRPQAYQDWRQTGGTPGSPRQPPAPTGKGSKPPRRRHPVRNVFLILILLVLATATWLVAVPARQVPSLICLAVTTTSTGCTAGTRRHARLPSRPR